MGLKDTFRNFLAPVDDEYDEEMDEVLPFEENDPYEKKEEEKKSRFSSSQTPVNTNKNQIQVVLVKPERFEDASIIADHLVNRRTVVLNVEGLGKDVIRRLLDFVTGVAYVLQGNVKMVAKDTYIATPRSVDLMGDILLDDLTSGYYR